MSNAGFKVARDPRAGITPDAVGLAREGRAIRFDGTPYAVTSQAATDALNPFVTGGVLIGAQAGQPLEIASAGYAIGTVVNVRVASSVTAGARLRPAFNADAALNDRFASVDVTALPSAAGTYYTYGRALRDGTTGSIVPMVIFPEKTVVEA